MMITPLQNAKHEPVSLTEAKAYCRVTHNLEDELITSLITAARELCERSARTPLSLQTFEARYVLPVRKTIKGICEMVDDADGVKHGIKLNRLPVHTVSEVRLIHSSDFAQDNILIAGTEYQLHGEQIVWVERLPLDGNYSEILVTYDAGYDVARNEDGSPVENGTVMCPQYMKQAILDAVAFLYNHRGDPAATIPRMIINKIKLFANYCLNSAG